MKIVKLFTMTWLGVSGFSNLQRTKLSVSSLSSLTHFSSSFPSRRTFLLAKRNNTNTISRRRRKRAEKKILYVLELKDGKYYVGSTNDLDQRYQQHCEGKGAAWTCKYPPIKILQTQKGTCFDEDALVHAFMAKYGIDNVRGGCYTKIDLDDVQQKAVTFLLRAGRNECFHCGSPDHFANKCPKLSQKLPTGEKEPSTKSQRGGSTSKTNPFQKVLLRPTQVCSRCGRNNHNVSTCYATTALDGRRLLGPAKRRSSSLLQTQSRFSEYYFKLLFEDCSDLQQKSPSKRNEQRGHQEMKNSFGEDNYGVRKDSSSPPPPSLASSCQLPIKNNVSTKKGITKCDKVGSWRATTSEQYKNSNSVCERCGRNSHTRSTCFARTHISGYLLKYPRN